MKVFSNNISLKYIHSNSLPYDFKLHNIDCYYVNNSTNNTTNNIYNSNAYKYYTKFIFQYIHNRTPLYIFYIPDSILEFLLLFELYNNNGLWSIEFNCSPNYILTYNINFAPSNIENIYNSNALQIIVSGLYNNLITFNIDKYENNNYLNNISSEDINFVKNNLNLVFSNSEHKLYTFQIDSIIKMYNIETNKSFINLNYTYEFTLNNLKLIYNPLTNKIVEDNKHITIKSLGGLLMYDKQLGKTVTCLGLINLNQAIEFNNIIYSKYSNINKIKSKATLIVCSLDSISNWLKEIKKFNLKLSVITITRKSNLNKISCKDIINADIILISIQFIKNIRSYNSFYCDDYTIDKELTYRNIKIKKILDNIDQSTYETLKNPIMEFFIFHRLIVDNINLLPTIHKENSLQNYVIYWINNIESITYWYVTNSKRKAFNNIALYMNFIKLEIINIDNNKIEFNNFDYSIKNFFYKDYILANIITSTCIIYSKKQLIDELNIIYNYKSLEFKLTNLELDIYNTKKNSIHGIKLLQLQTSPFILSEYKCLYNTSEINIFDEKKSIIEDCIKNISKYKNNILALNIINQEYSSIKNYNEKKISELQYLYNTLLSIDNTDSINNLNITCTFCMDTIIDPIMLYCGHIFCYVCLKKHKLIKNNCPICAKEISNKLLVFVDKNNIIVNKYGSKIGNILIELNKILLIKDSFIIIYSRWNDFLISLSHILEDNQISNMIIKSKIISKKHKLSVGLMLLDCVYDEDIELPYVTHILFSEPIEEYRRREIEINKIFKWHIIGTSQLLNVLEYSIIYSED